MKETVTRRLDRETSDALERAAQRTGLSVPALMNKLVRMFLRRLVDSLLAAEKHAGEGQQ